MACYALTGTPGTGKTSVSVELRAKGFEVLDLSEYIAENGLLGTLDAERETREVDVAELRKSLQKAKKADGIVMEGHLSHYLGCDVVIVLRCHPDTLAQRLESRGYGKKKITENVRAEVLDVILSEAMDSGARVYEIDTTTSDAITVAGIMEGIMTGKSNHPVGNSVDWSQEMEKWF